MIITATEQSTIERALAPTGLHATYQPIVDLTTRGVMAYEALARWHDRALAPEDVFRAAAAAGRTAELDWRCRRAAIDGALLARLDPRTPLFVNVEPRSLTADRPAWADDLYERASQRLQIVLELTERSLLASPAEVMRLVGEARDRGWGVALDDVGAVPESLTMLAFVEPDVIKLDLSLIQQRPSADQGRIMSAVLAHSEVSGAIILAEGIENERHLEQALTLGATVGQGWHFGRPGDLIPGAPPAKVLRIDIQRVPVPASPFSVVRDSARLGVGRCDVLLGISAHLEALGHGADDLVVLGSFQHADRFTPATRRRYEALANRCPLVGALGVGMPSVPAPGVRGANLHTNDSLVDEWAVVVVGAHYAGALLARDLGDDGPRGSRRFAFVVTHDRGTVVAAARSLMARITSQQPDGATRSTSVCD